MEDKIKVKIDDEVFELSCKHESIVKSEKIGAFQMFDQKVCLKCPMLKEMAAARKNL